MKTSAFGPGLCSVLLILFSSITNAAELIETPSGVVVRTLLDWEETSGLEINNQTAVETIPVLGNAASYKFSKTLLCGGAAFRTLQAVSVDWFDLSGLCQADKEDSVSFVFISDTQQYHDKHKISAASISNLIDSNPDIRFIINGGDLVQEGTHDEWAQYRQIATKYYSNKIPLVPVVGNHEFRDDEILARRNWIYADAETEAHYYVLDFKAMSLIVLDSNIDLRTDEENDRQTAWLKRTLQTLSSAADSKPIFVTFHHPAYSSGPSLFTMPKPPRYIKANWTPLFAEYGVRMVLNGHEHIYERFDVDGLKHITAGPAGGTMTPLLPFHSSYSVFLQARTRTATVFTVYKNGNVHLKTIDTETRDIVEELDW